MHPLYEQDPARKRLKSRHSFLHSVEPLDGSAHSRRLTLWSSHLQTTPHKLSFSPKESLPPGSSETWPTWSSLNRLRTGTGRCKSLMHKWGFNEDGQTTCECGDEQTMNHLLVCPCLPQPCRCTHEDMEEFNPPSEILRPALDGSRVVTRKEEGKVVKENNLPVTKNMYSLSVTMDQNTHVLEENAIQLLWLGNFLG